jgi:NAD(P)-dependent dehydrogenase (short-subunit alcohol dehydrogenase family)
LSIAIDLSGQSAIVTGAGSGIGEAIARTLAAAGAAVVIGDVREEAATAVASSIVASGGTAVPAAFDIADSEAVAKALAAARAEVGPLRIVVNNAASWAVKLFADTTLEEIDRIFAVTVHGTMNVTRAALDDLVAQPGGRVISVASDSARTGEAWMAAYASAKAALLGFSKSLAKEVGRAGCTVNVVCPGTTKTPGGQDFIDKAGGPEKLAKPYPLGRIGEPEDIANAVLFFASPLASWITGQVLSVSGGYTMV